MSERIGDLNIERMREEDLSEVLRIEKESFSDPWTEECFLEDLHRELSYPAVAKIGGKVVGYTCLWKILDELQIANIAVDKGYRRKGIAQKLMAWVIQQGTGQGCKRITLDVRESNIIALEFYRKYGFEKIGQRKNYYCYPVEDAIIMEKKL